MSLEVDVGIQNRSLIWSGRVQKAWLRELVGNPGWTPGCREPGAELASAQPLNEEPVQPVGRVQWNPVAGVVDLLIAPGPFTKRPDIFMRSPSK